MGQNQTFTLRYNTIKVICKNAVLKSIFQKTLHIKFTDTQYSIVGYTQFCIPGPGTLRVGAGVNGGSRYTGFLQDVRIYGQRLSHSEITELHATPAKNDLHPISGYLEYRQGEVHKSFVVSARDDSDEEGEELFMLKLVSVFGGARVPEENTTALIRILKSDNANGLFGFTGPCIPQVRREP